MSGLRRSIVWAFALCAGCSSQGSSLTSSVTTSNVTYGLAGGVAVIDDSNHRVVLLQGQSGQQLAPPQSFPIGHGFQSAAVSPDGYTLFVLSAGDQPVQTPQDEQPSLTMLRLDRSLQATRTKYLMQDPLSQLSVDPMGDYVVAWSGSSTAFAENPNEIVIFDLSQGYATSPGSASAPPNPIARSIRSYGGTPQVLSYSPVLNLPVNPPPGATASLRRLLFIQTQIDVSIVDLTNAFEPVITPTITTFGRPEITVRLTSGTSSASLTPTGLVVDPNQDDGRVAFFTSGDHNVYTMQLLPSTDGSPNDFVPQINLTDVGGSPSDVEFVHTDAGLRVAALVPSAASAVLVEPDTSETTQVSLSAGFTNLSLVTSIVSGDPSPSGPDVALLWSTQSGVSAGVALWTLGTSVGQPYRSIEVLPVDEPIQSVLDVPGATYRNLKILAPQPNQGAGNFYVLDLIKYTASPIHTNQSPYLSLSPDGLRMWAYDHGTDLAQIDFGTLDPVRLTTSAPISAVYDMLNLDLKTRSLVAIDDQGALAAIVFDAISPLGTARTNPALLLEAP